MLFYTKVDANQESLVNEIRKLSMGMLKYSKSYNMI